MSVSGQGRLLHGLRMHGTHQVPVPFTKQMDSAIDQADAIAEAATPLTEVEPKDRGASDVISYATLDLSNYWLSYDGIERRMRIPDVLTSLVLTYEKGGGDTSYVEAADTTASGSYSVGVSLSGQAQASAFVLPKIIPTLHETWSFNQPVSHYFYFGQAFDQATILAKLSAKLGTTVNAWPVFKPESITLKLVGQRTSSNARATFQGSVSSHSGGDSTSESAGFGEGQEFSPQVETVQIPATLHGAITLSPSSSSQTNTATAGISASGIIGGGGGGVANCIATGSVTPTSIPATSPAGVPTSGLYLFDFDIEPAETFGWFYAHAVVFDFAKLT